MALIGVWVLSAVNFVMVAAVLAWVIMKETRVRRTERAHLGRELPLGARIPSLSCRNWLESGALNRESIGVVRPQSVIVFLRPRSAASFRFTGLWLELIRRLEPAVPWTWMIVGDLADVSRWVKEFGLQRCAVYCADNRWLRRWMGSVPTVVFVDADRRIAQAGAVNDELTLAQVIAGCPEKSLRDWFSAASVAVHAPAGTPAV